MTRTPSPESLPVLANPPREMRLVFDALDEAADLILDLIIDDDVVQVRL